MNESSMAPSEVSDMLFFERRLTEVISHMQPTAVRWRIALAFVFSCTVYSSYFWIIDPSIRFISLWESLSKHPLFTASFVMLMVLFFIFGIHKRVIAPKIIAARCRTVLADFCLSCDENGKLIVRPAYATPPGDRLANFALKEELRVALTTLRSKDAFTISHINAASSAITEATTAAVDLARQLIESSVPSAEAFGVSEVSNVNDFLASDPTNATFALDVGNSSEASENSKLASLAVPFFPRGSNRSLVADWAEPVVSRVLSDAAAHVASAVSAAAAVISAPQSLTNFTDEGGAFAFDSNNSAWPLENATTTMMVVEQKAVELLPLDTMIHTMLFGLAALFMVIGGAIPYVFQYAEIHKRKNALGFSLLVCLALCVANILRILFWFGKRFETVLLVQSVVMTTCMILMLEISVRMNKKHVPKGQRKSIWKGDVFSAFWKWNDLSSFIVALAAFTLLASIITVIFTRFPIYVEGLGLVALLTEACLGLPQLIRNFQRKATTGMSVKMVTLWLVGDLGKTTYFIVRGNPAQFWVCGFLQITIDILILLQVFFYGRRARSSRMPQYAAPAAAEKL